MAAKNKLHPAIAFVLMLAMLCCALIWGANKAWTEKSARVQTEYTSLREAVELRVETAYNLLKVAGRHLPGDDKQVSAVQTDLRDMEDAYQPLYTRVAACDKFVGDAQLLLQHMATLPGVQADSRDEMYVTLMLPGAVEQCQNTSEFLAYDSAAADFNDGLNTTFSGWLAQLVGFEPAQRIAEADAVETTAQYMPSLQTTYPQQSGYVNDDAAVLSSQTIADIKALNERLEDVNFVVATRHFLGNKDAQAYCDGLFDTWQLSENEVLLMMVIGEERYAVHLGEKVKNALPNEQLSSLLSAHFRAPFINERDYDGAVGDFLLSAGERLAQAYGDNVSFGGLFGTEETKKVNQSIFDNWTGDWWSGFFADSGSDAMEEMMNAAGDHWKYEAYEEDSGIGRLAVIAIMLVAISAIRKRKGKRGLGLIGWILAFSGFKEVRKIFGGPRR